VLHNCDQSKGKEEGKMKSPNTKTRYGSFVLYLALCTVLMIMLPACGSSTSSSDSDDSSSDTGSIAFGLKLQQGTTASSDRHTAPIDCKASGISTVEASLYSADDTLLASGGPWNCKAHGGKIKDIPVGDNCKLVALGKDASGNALYRGEKTGINIRPGKNDAGEIILNLISSKWDEMVWDRDKWG